MPAPSTNALLARVAPAFIERFQQSGAVDFRVFPGDTDRLLVFLRFADARGHWGDLEALEAIALEAGLTVESRGANHNSAWIELLLLPAGEVRGLVLPFRPRRLRPA